MQFKASLEGVFGKKKGWARISNTIARNPNLSVDAKWLYSFLAGFSESIKISDEYIRRFIIVNNNNPISVQRLRKAKSQLINSRLLKIKKTNYHRINYEWILMNEKADVIKHFNKDYQQEEFKKRQKERSNSGGDFNSKTPVNSTFSAGLKRTAEKSAIYNKDTRAFNNNINLNNNNLENLENLNLKKEIKENKEIRELKENEERNFKESVARCANFDGEFFADFSKLDEEDLEAMAKKGFKVPKAEELIAQVKRFNDKHGTSFDIKQAEDFIEYWDAREWKRGGRRMDSVGGSFHTWLKNSLEWGKQREAKKGTGFKIGKTYYKDEAEFDAEIERAIREYSHSGSEIINVDLIN